MSEIGGEVKRSVAVAKTLALAKCGHEEGAEASAANCLKSLVGVTNREHYIIGTQDRGLRQQLERVPGAPAMFLTAHGLTIETPSALHKVHAQPLRGSAAHGGSAANPPCNASETDRSHHSQAAGRGRKGREGVTIGRGPRKEGWCGKSGARICASQDREVG